MRKVNLEGCTSFPYQAFFLPLTGVPPCVRLVVASKKYSFRSPDNNETKKYSETFIEQAVVKLLSRGQYITAAICHVNP